MDKQVAGPPPGWYPYPGMAHTQRYWNGYEWTDMAAPAPVGRHAPELTEGVNDNLIVAGYIAAVVVPIVGFVIGFVVIAKGATWNGLAMLVVSVAAGFAWASYLAPNTLGT